jgi:tetratricopeptide (TPR) repeat protein
MWSSKDLGTLYVGGTYQLSIFGDLPIEMPMFAFIVKDLAATNKLLYGMYIETGVRFNTAGQLAYHLSVPDRQHTPWAIPLKPEDLPRIQRGVNQINACPTLIMDSGDGRITLERFLMDITHDWSGVYARSHQSFLANQIDTAIQLITPLTAENPDSLPHAHHLLGKCYRAKGDATLALDSYYRALLNTRDSMGENFTPLAAGILSDMGVLFKRLGDLEKAIHCLLYSLHLRANHPEALVTFVTLFPEQPQLVTFGIARIMAIGGRDDLIKTVATGYAQAAGISSQSLISEAKKLSKNIDLAKWPLAMKEFTTFASFDAGLNEPGKLAHFIPPTRYY